MLPLFTAIGQNAPIDFEADGFGADWIWTMFENDSNPPLEVIANPDPTGINTSDSVMKFTALETGMPFAGCETLHGAGIGTFTITEENKLIDIMVWKSVISDVGIKLVRADNWSLGEIKIANTTTDQWEKITFDFSAHIGNTYDQIVIFPDFDLAGRTSDNVIYIDNIYGEGATVPQKPTLPITFEIDSIAYGLFGFGEATAELIDNPDASGINTSSKVASINKMEGAQVWAGVSIPLEEVIDLSNGAFFSMKVWSPNAGEPIMLKLEDTTSPPDANGNPSIISEVQRTTSLAGAWETLMYDMSEHPGYDAANNYNQVVVFPNFGQAGVAGGATYYIDDIQKEIVEATEEQLRSIGQLKTFPNPVKNQININYEIINRGNISFTLVNILGKTVSTFNAGHVNTGIYTEQIDVNTISNGTYFLVMKFDGEVVRHQKLIIQK